MRKSRERERERERERKRLDLTRLLYIKVRETLCYFFQKKCELTFQHETIHKEIVNKLRIKIGILLYRSKMYLLNCISIRHSCTMAIISANLMVINLDISLFTFRHLPADTNVYYVTVQICDAKCLKSISIFYHCIRKKM